MSDSISSVFEFHPIAARYPLLEGAAFEELKASILANGQAVEVEIFEGRFSMVATDTALAGSSKSR